MSYVPCFLHESDVLEGLCGCMLTYMLHVFGLIYIHFICLCAVSQHCEVRGCGKFKGWLSLFIKPMGSPSRSVRDAPSLNHVFMASICLTTASQLLLSHDDRYEYPSPFWLCSSSVLHVWMSSSVCALCASPPNKGTSFAWVPEQALLIDLSQD